MPGEKEADEVTLGTPKRRKKRRMNGKLPKTPIKVRGSWTSRSRFSLCSIRAVTNGSKGHRLHRPNGFKVIDNKNPLPGGDEIRKTEYLQNVNKALIKSLIMISGNPSLP